jgi:hypothetical protein
MTLAEAVETGWPFRRKGMVRWMETTESGRFVILKTDSRGGDRSMVGREAEPHNVIASDLTSDDWEILVWNSGRCREDGIYRTLPIEPAGDRKGGE